MALLAFDCVNACLFVRVVFRLTAIKSFNNENKICDDSSTRSHWKINNSGKIVGKNCKWLVQADGAVVCHKSKATEKIQQ